MKNEIGKIEICKGLEGVAQSWEYTPPAIEKIKRIIREVLKEEGLIK